VHKNYIAADFQLLNIVLANLLEKSVIIFRYFFLAAMQRVMEFLGNLVKVRCTFNNIPASIYTQLLQERHNPVQKLRYAASGECRIDILDDFPPELGRY